MSQNYDVIILGGGIIGNSIAAHLAMEMERQNGKASKKLKIVVINSLNLGMPASNAAAGLLTPFQLSEIENSKIKEFCFKSFEYFFDFYKTIKSSIRVQDISLGFKQSGSLYLIFSNQEIPKKENEIKELKSIQGKVSFLNKQEVLKYEPLVTKEIIGAYHFPEEAYINNPKFIKAISLYCEERKIIHLNSELQELNINKDRVESITLTNGEKLEANTYVLCNGAWANKFLKKLFNTNENIIKAIKGEILQVEATPELPLQKIIFCKDGYLLPRPATNSFEKESILIGSTFDEVDIENGKNVFHNTVLGVSQLTSMFQNVLPSCKEYSIINQWSGLRPKSADNLPILGKASSIENIYLACGHYRSGILMGPLTGKILSDLILENHTEHNIDIYNPERFLKQHLLPAS